MSDVNKIQWSKKFPDGTILMVGGENIEEFSYNYQRLVEQAEDIGLGGYLGAKVVQNEPEQGANKESAPDNRPGDVSHVNHDFSKPVPRDLLPPELNDLYDYYMEFFDAIDVTRKGDRVTILFYQDGLQYPVGKMNRWTIDDAKEVLGAFVNELDLEHGGTVKTRGKVYWYYGKAYKKRDGSEGRYKDVALAEKPLE